MTKPLQDLIDSACAAATEARDRAYAPYSQFPMGAAVADSDGTIIEGVLIENVSLGLAMCAERVALFQAVTTGSTPVVLAMCSKRTEGELTFPCGACLQVALEVAGRELLVVAVDPDGVRDQATLGELLPQAPKRFSPHDGR